MAGVSLVDDRAALLSMRNSDFDAYSAIGEVIDNSIQAEARNVRLVVEFKANRQESLTSIAFGDDGSGMSGDVLHRCLQLGYSTRYNDRHGIGRFGVGATLAAINQCRKIEVSSKEKGGEWLYTYIDLDLIATDPPKMKHIPTPTRRAVPGELAELVGLTSGTLVVWSKCDRQPAPASKLIEELRVWIGRTYRKFIWDGVSIFINGDVVKAVDPLYVTTTGTRFPEDPKAYEYEEILLPWPVPPEDRRDGGPTESIIRIRMSLLPEEFRPAEENGNTRHASERYIDLNEGVSILRNNREVFYGRIPWWPGTPFGEIDRWWGCEISFDAILDSQFTVKNIKRGALPVRDLKQAIKEKIEPTRRAALEQIELPLTSAASAEEATTPAPPAMPQRPAPVPVVQLAMRKSRPEEVVFGLLGLAASVGVVVALRGAWGGGIGRGDEAPRAVDRPAAPSVSRNVTTVPQAAAAASYVLIKAMPSGGAQLQLSELSVENTPKADHELTALATAPPPAEPVRFPASRYTGFVLGSGQRGRVGEPASLPVVFEVRDSSGTPIPGEAVSLSVANGRLVDLQDTTDQLGQVRAQVVFGPRAGVPTVVTGTVSAFVREATLYPTPGSPAQLEVVFDGTALGGQIVVPASGPAELRIFCRDSYGNALPLVGLRAAVGDDHVVQVLGATVDSLGGSVIVRAGRRGGATNLVIHGSGLRTDLSAVVAPAEASP